MQLMTAVSKTALQVRENIQSADRNNLIKHISASEPQHYHQRQNAQNIDKRTEYRIHEHLPVKSLVELCIFIMKFLKLALLPAKYLYNFHPRKMLRQKCIDVRQARTV